MDEFEDDLDAIRSDIDPVDPVLCFSCSERLVVDGSLCSECLSDNQRVDHDKKELRRRDRELRGHTNEYGRRSAKSNADIGGEADMRTTEERSDADDGESVKHRPYGVYRTEGEKRSERMEELRKKSDERR